MGITKTVLLLEDHPSTADFLSQALRAIYPERKVFIHQTVTGALKWLKEGNSPSLALIDLGLPDGSGLKVLKEIKKNVPETVAIIVTIYGDNHNLFEALAAGADGYILKDENQGLVVETLKRIQNCEPPLSPEIALKLMGHFRRPVRESEECDLTPRERETLQLIAKGYTVPEAAKAIGLSPQTVAGYVKNIYQKLHVSSRAEATSEAIRRGII